MAVSRKPHHGERSFDHGFEVLARQPELLWTKGHIFFDGRAEELVVGIGKDRHMGRSSGVLDGLCNLALTLDHHHRGLRSVALVADGGSHDPGLDNDEIRPWHITQRLFLHGFTMKTTPLRLVSRLALEFPVLTLYLVPAHKQRFPVSVSLPEVVDDSNRQHGQRQVNPQAPADNTKNAQGLSHACPAKASDRRYRGTDGPVGDRKEECHA